MSCITHKYKNRNVLKQRDIHISPNKYLTPNELRKVSCINDLTKYKKHKSLNLTRKYNKQLKLINALSFKQPKIKMNLKKYNVKRVTCISYNFYSIHEKNKEYVDYYYINNGVHTKVLDVSKLAKGFEFFEIHHLELSPSNDYIAFNVDFDGSRAFHLFIKPLYMDNIEELPITNNKETMLSTHDSFGHTQNHSETFTWLDSDHIAFVLNNKFYNNNKSYVYNISSRKREPLYTNKHSFVNFETTRDGYYHMLYDSDYNSDEVYLFDTFKLSKPLFKREPDVTYPIIDHMDGLWYILERNKGTNIIKTTTNFKTYTIRYKNNKTYERVKYMYLYNHIIYFILISTRKKYIYKLDKQKITKLLEFDKKYYLDFDSCNHCVNRHSYLSPMKCFPLETKDVEKHPMVIETKDVEKHPMVIETKDEEDYVERNVYIKPLLFITLMYKKGHSLKHSKCVVYGYGTYGDDFDRGYSPEIKYLLDKGFLVIYAHLRGGGENGFKSYDEGRLLNKKNTFDDMIECIHYLFRNKYTTRDKLAIWGRSAGGVLISAVINIDPTICRLAILGVPFIEITKSLMSHTNPLSFESHSEYGDPRIKKHRDYIESYEPLKHINPDGDYPNIYIYTNLNDTLVPYKHSVSYYNEMKKKVHVFKGKKEINLYIDKKYGHTQGSSVSDKHRSLAQIYTQIEKFIV